MSPNTSTADNVATRGVPLNVSHTVVLNGLHQLEVGGKVLLSLVLLTLKVHVPEVEVEVGLGVNGSDNNETTLG